MKRISVSLSDDDYETLAGLAEADARSVAATATILIRASLREPSNADAVTIKTLSDRTATTVPRKACAKPKPRPQNPLLCYNCGGRMVDHQ